MKPFEPDPPPALVKRIAPNRRAAAKSSGERIAKLRARHAALNRFEVRGLFAHADDHSEIKAAAGRIALRRERVEKRAIRASRTPG